MSITKILDRVRKMLALAEHSDNEAEAALAATRAAKLMEEYQLSEALVRLDDPEAKPEAILRNERLEPDVSEQLSRKRVAWKEAIASAVAKDLGVHQFFWSRSVRTTNDTWRKVVDVRGFGRESAIQTWRYTCQYLWRQIEELADKDAAVRDFDSTGTCRAWKNAFRIGCAQRLATRIHENRAAEREQAEAAREAVAYGAAMGDRASLALCTVEREQIEVDEEYAEVRKGFTGSVGRIGAQSSYGGYRAGREAGDSVALGKARAGLPAGQGRLT
jgi:hypothetical protein